MVGEIDRYGERSGRFRLEQSRRKLQAFEREQLRRRVDDIASSLSVPAGRPSASERLAALRLRVGIKISSPATD